MKSPGRKISNYEVLSCRQVLAAMIMFSVLMLQIHQNTMPLAIVRMIGHYNPNISSATNRFNWNENEKSDILGSYFWGHLISKVPAGRLSELYGPRIVFGVALLMSTLITFITPAACYLGAYGAILSRLILGINLSFLLPTLPTLVKKWVPPTTRHIFGSHLLAFSSCIFLGLLVYGYLISLFQWSGIFYFVGCISLVWTVAWFRFVHDSPEQHPRITDDEKNEIQRAIKEEVWFNDSEKVPWLNIFTSGPVWACIVAYAAFAFSNSMTASQMPSYLRQVINVDLRKLGFLSNIPYLMSYLTAVSLFCMFDPLNGTPGSTVMNLKILFSLGFLIQLLLFLAQTFFGYSGVLTIVTFSICEVIGCGGLLLLLVNIMDLSPNFAGTIYGIAAMCGDIVSYLQTKVVAVYTYEHQDFEHWQSVFLFTVVTKAIGLVVYYGCSSRDIQKWDVKKEDKEKLLV